MKRSLDTIKMAGNSLEIKVTDLLDRETVFLQSVIPHTLLKWKNILVTGAAPHDLWSNLARWRSAFLD